MKKISNWSLAGMTVGAVFALGSFIRYYIIYSDLDRMLAYTSLGLLIMAVSWLYWKQLDHNHRLEAVEEYLEDLHQANHK